jgi:hypothetical protein
MEYSSINMGADLANRYKGSFGFIATNAVSRAGIGMAGKFAYVRVPTMQPEQKKQQGDVKVDLYEPAEAVKMSQLGTPIFDAVEFRLDEEYSYSFPFCPMVDLGRTKHIKTTDINDSDGEVVEMISNKPWSIRFRGLLVNMENHHYPYDQVGEINRLFELKATLKVSSQLFNELGISELYFTDLELSALEGFVDTQPFVLTARSHVATEILLLD